MGATLEPDIEPFYKLSIANNADRGWRLVQRIEMRPIRMRIVKNEDTALFAPQIVTKLSAFATFLDVDSKESEYDIVLWRGKVYFTRPDDTFRPLVVPLVISNKNCLDKLLDYMQHIAHWHSLNDLKNENKDSSLDNALKMEAFTVDNGVETPVLASNTEGVVIDLKFDVQQKNWRRYLKVKVTNNSDKDLYVLGILNSDDFSVDTSWLQPQGVQFLEAGSSYIFSTKEPRNPELLPLTREQSNYWYNWEKESLSFKVVYSEEQFTNHRFNLDPLDKAYYPRMVVDRGRSRGGTGDNKEDFYLKNWNTLDYPFYIKNPTYNQVTQEDIALMLKDPLCSDFAEALYGTESTIENSKGKQ